MLKELPKYSPEEMAKADASAARLAASKRPATVGWVSKNLDGAMEMVARHVHDLRRAVKDLEAKTTLLEEQQLRYTGVHDTAKQYVAGDIATFRGGLWHANVTTKSLPGKSNDWRLMAKTPVARGGAK